MSMVSCGNGHFYNDEEHSSCPFCGVGLELHATRPLAGEGGSPRPVAESGHTRAAGTPPPAGLGRDAGETRHVWAGRMGGVDPVVGWLVCVAGPERGRDYRLHTERNFIGRSPTMDVAITGDATISRENHAIVSYNPKRHTFRLAPGDSRGLVYLNEEEVIAPVELAPYDLIELGETKLLFVPFCGERFVWPVDAPASPDQHGTR
ncbi:FHA domain-containing protein [Thiocystis violascens]|uniref:FHA domain-containing protein n=1 Tax=Thiocystis violascens (strain ATCC 17096 / DSM 198 / 6111) TaxID=765911 RepID=I3YAI8_THIV6|nr:FHA domain-containing protein [Thiocystis violascens]AFL74006.1 FHA domain-containing protein [Thiocystis violascens DSM 198]